MLLVFGLKIRLTTVAPLVFFCPTCGGDRPGARRAARRWLTLFWVPVVPLGRAGEVVECETCHTRFDPTVADRPTTAHLASILDDAVRVLTAMVVASGDSQDPALRAAAVERVAPILAGYDDDTLSGDIEVLDPALAGSYVEPLAEGLEVTGKESLLADLVRVALAGVTVTPDQRRVIEAAGRGLGLTAAHITGVVTSTVAAHHPRPAPDPDSGPPAL